MNGNQEINFTAAPPSRLIAYWISTGILAAQVGTGAFLDLTRNQAFSKITIHLGYPLYILTVLGIARVFALIALLAPRFPRLKEWVYAGLIFEFALGFISHIVVGDGATAWIWPLLFMNIAIASWYLRPPSRKLEDK